MSIFQRFTMKLVSHSLHGLMFPVSLLSVWPSGAHIPAASWLPPSSRSLEFSHWDMTESVGEEWWKGFLWAVLAQGASLLHVLLTELVTWFCWDTEEPGCHRQFLGRQPPPSNSSTLLWKEAWDFSDYLVISFIVTLATYQPCGLT